MPKYKLKLEPSNLPLSRAQLITSMEELVGKSEEESSLIAEDLLNGKTVDVFFEYDRDLIPMLKEKLSELGIVKSLELTNLPKKSEEEIAQITNAIIEKDHYTFVLVERIGGLPLVYTVSPTQYMRIEEEEVHLKVIETLRQRGVKEMSIEEFNYRYLQ